MYIADDALQFFFHYMSLLDLVSIVTPFIYLLVQIPSKYVYFLGLLRISRAARVLRTYRLLSFAQSEETREIVTFGLNFLNFIFFSASMINATESIVGLDDAKADFKNWHDSLYYIMVTFSTIGFGDLTPNSVVTHFCLSQVSRVIVMFLIVLVILYIPYQTGQILDLFKSLNKYQRAQHSPSIERPHIIIGGNLTYSAIIDFCRAYFQADPIGHVVIIKNDEPDIDIRRFLNHPIYR